MKHLGTLFTLSIVLFWVLMNTLLVHRELELRNQDHYQRGVIAFLGDSLVRERWMGIYREHKKVGYSGYVLEKVPALEGVEYNLDVETLWRGKLPLPGILADLAGKKNQLEIQGQLVLDGKLKPRKLRVDISLTLLEGSILSHTHRFFIVGERVEEDVHIKFSAGEKDLFEIRTPADDFTLSDGLTPTLPVAGYKVGESYRLRVFDPLAFAHLDLGDNTALIHVKEQRTEEVNGLLTDVYVLETQFRGTKTISLVTTAGEVLEQKLGPPLNLILRREVSREKAIRGFR